MSNEKYVNGLIIKERTFDNGGSQMKVSIKMSDFLADIKEIAGNDEWVNLIINRRKEPSDTGITHYMKVDTWKPKPQGGGMANQNAASDDGLPF